MALAVLVVGGLYELIPSAFRVSTVFQLVFPVVLVVLRATLVAGARAGSTGPSHGCG